MRASLLAHDPQLGPVDMATLVGIANAIEHEAVRRYEQLEQTMRRRGEHDTADAFRRMIDEEREHVEAIARLARSLDIAVPETAAFEWILPRELSASWDAIAGSALLTPYRAFAIAVENEQRAFAFYSYVAAHANDRAVAGQAERLAAEELQHAARIRQWRREAYHRERAAGGALAAESDEALRTLRSPAALHAFLCVRHASIAASYRALAARLRELGDETGARLLESFVDAHPPEGDAATGAAIDDEERRGIARCDDALHLIVAAQRPLEQLGESLERILSISSDEVLELAEQAATDVVSWLGRLALHAERIETRGALSS